MDCEGLESDPECHPTSMSKETSEKKRQCPWLTLCIVLCSEPENSSRKPTNNKGGGSALGGTSESSRIFSPHLHEHPLLSDVSFWDH